MCNCFQTGSSKPTPEYALNLWTSRCLVQCFSSLCKANYFFVAQYLPEYFKY